MDKNRIVQYIAILCVIGLFTFLGLGMRENSAVAKVGDPGFNFQLEDLDGKVHTLSDHKGKPVVLNFFATWCAPCVEEAPELEAFEKEYKDLAKLLIIDKGEPKERVTKFVEEHKTTSTYIFDFSNKVSKKYGLTGQPETFIIDKNGIIREHIIGLVSKDMLAEKISQLQ